METQFTYLVELARLYSEYNRDPRIVYQALNALSEMELRDIYAEYGDLQTNFRPVNLLRAEVARLLLAGESVDEEKIEQLKQKITAKEADYFSHYDKDFLKKLQESEVDQKDSFRSWQKAWSIFYPFFYRGDVRKTVELYQQQIAKQLQSDLQLTDYVEHIVGFQGSQNFGTDWAWLALFPRAKQSHQESYQFFLQFADNSEAGLVVGRNLKVNVADRRSAVGSYAEALQVLLSCKEEIVRLNTQIRNYFKFSPGPQAIQWKNFYQQGIAALDFNDLDVGDMSTIATWQELNLRAGLEADSSSNSTWNLWLFRCAQIGDVLFANEGANTIVGIGVVAGDYYYEETEPKYKHRRRIDWFADKIYQNTTHKFKNLFRLDTFSPTKRWHEILIDYLRQYPEFQAAYTNYELPQELEPAKITEIATEGGEDLEEVEVERDISYWWLNANPNIWSISKHRDGHRQTYTTHNENGNKRRIYRYFEAVQPGDIVIGYESSPVKQIKALIEITKAMHQSETEGEVIEFEIIKKFEVPIHWNELQNNPALRECEVFINNQGSLFQLTDNEFDIILDIIDEKHIRIEQQQGETLQPYRYAVDPDRPFLAEESFRQIVALLKRKKNIILQGPPGVGKTFVAKKLAYEMMGHRNDANIEMIQFHQSYSYEDFIQGLRPNRNNGFELKNGVFYTFCQKAHAHPDRQFFFIIDEINRGNLSKIFGELMLLMEADKRAEKWAINLTYAEDDQDRFFIPANVHIIGTMNTADRSLAIVDYALRRRFAFVNLVPDFGNLFSDYMSTKGISARLVAHIQQKLARINQQIGNDDNLGLGFQIGHAYFCTYHDGMDEMQWFHEVLTYEIRPLLEEIWFDDLDKVEQLLGDLSL